MRNIVTAQSVIIIIEESDNLEIILNTEPGKGTQCDYIFIHNSKKEEFLSEKMCPMRMALMMCLYRNKQFKDFSYYE
jgi:hypothetical protein